MTTTGLPDIIRAGKTERCVLLENKDSASQNLGVQKLLLNRFVPI